MEAFELLVGHKKTDLNYVNNGETRSILMKAVASNNIEMIEVLLAEKSLLLNAKVNGETALDVAAGLGNKKILNILLSDPRIDVRQTNIGTTTRILFEAVGASNLEQIRALIIEKGVDPNIYEGYAEETVLMQAISNKQRHVVEILLQSKKIDVNIIANERCALMITCRLERKNKKMFPFLELLMNNPEFNPNITVGNSNTVLYEAVRLGDTLLAEKLLSHGGIDLEQVSQQAQDTVLMKAISRGNLKIVKLMIKSKKAINVNYLKEVLRGQGYSMKYESALSLALDQPKKNILGEILEFAETDPNLPLNSNNMTAIYRAVANNDLQMVTLLLKSPKIKLDVIPRGEDRTVLLKAIENSNLDIVKKLISGGVNVHQAIGDLFPLYLAATIGIEKKSFKMFDEILKKRNAQVEDNIVADSGTTLLYHCIVQRQVVLATKLIQSNRINVNFVNKEVDRSVLMEAINQGLVNIVRLLVQNTRTQVDVVIKGRTALTYVIKEDKNAIVKGYAGEKLKTTNSNGEFITCSP